jgi:hypothetical protein
VLNEASEAKEATLREVLERHEDRRPRSPLELQIDRKPLDRSEKVELQLSDPHLLPGFGSQLKQDERVGRHSPSTREKGRNLRRIPDPPPGKGEARIDCIHLKEACPSRLGREDDGGEAYPAGDLRTGRHKGIQNLLNPRGEGFGGVDTEVPSKK